MKPRFWAALASLGSPRRRAAQRPPERRVRVSGLDDEVEVIIDRWGVPHIYARSRRDAFFAQGFMHARDRLLQLEISRRAGMGTLSELFGSRTLEIDRFLRRVGLHRAARAEERLLDGDTRSVLESYAAGVTAGAGGPSMLVIRLLGGAFRSWTVLDSLAYGRVTAMNLAMNWDAELARAEILVALGPEEAAAVEPRFSDLHPSVVGAVRASVPSIHELRRRFEAVADVVGFGRGAGSNAWAVAPDRTATGRPILANDPHLQVQIPSIWYEQELSAPGLHVAGAGLPGVPGILIGHNERVGWGITAAMGDVQDVAVVPREAADRAIRLREEIRVRRRAPVIEEVLLTDQGPVLERGPRGELLALRSTTLEEQPHAGPILSLMDAGDWASFRNALSGLVAPSLCYIYADVDGNIGLQVAGFVPRRRHSAGGYLPWPANDGRFGWDGYVPFDELPHEYNPPSGLIVTANNQLESGPELTVPGEFVDGYRALRLHQLLGDRRDVTVADCRVMQADAYATHADELLETLAGWQPDNPRLAAALERLRRWDRRVTTDSAEAALFEVFMLRLLWKVLRHRIGEQVRHYLGSPNRGLSVVPPLSWRVVSLVLRALREPDGWFTSPEEREAVLNRTLDEALRELRTRLGADPSRWSWGRLHRISFRHQLGSSRPLRRLLNRGPLPAPGDMHTVSQASYLTYRPYDVDGAIPSYRQIIDVGNWRDCWSMHVPGQSENPFSRHYDDLLGPWHRVEYHPMLFDRASVEQHAERRMMLKPR